MTPLEQTFWCERYSAWIERSMNVKERHVSIAELCILASERADFDTDQFRMRFMGDVSDKQASLWISTKDRLPVIGDCVLVVRPDSAKTVRKIHFITWSEQDENDFTHWQPCPEFPLDVVKTDKLDTAIDLLDRNNQTATTTLYPWELLPEWVTDCATNGSGTSVGYDKTPTMNIGSHKWEPKNGTKMFIFRPHNLENIPFSDWRLSLEKRPGGEK